MKREKKRKAQVSLELSLALIGVLILLMGTLNLFLWLNKRFVLRQQAYESKRVEAGSGTSTAEVQVADSENEIAKKLNMIYMNKHTRRAQAIKRILEQQKKQDLASRPEDISTDEIQVDDSNESGFTNLDLFEDEEVK